MHPRNTSVSWWFRLANHILLMNRYHFASAPRTLKIIFGVHFISYSALWPKITVLRKKLALLRSAPGDCFNWSYSRVLLHQLIFCCFCQTIVGFSLFGPRVAKSLVYARDNKLFSGITYALGNAFPLFCTVLLCLGCFNDDANQVWLHGTADLFTLTAFWQRMWWKAHSNTLGCVPYAGARCLLVSGPSRPGQCVFTHVLFFLQLARLMCVIWRHRCGRL